MSKIVLLDDDLDLAEMLTIFLEDMGYCFLPIQSNGDPISKMIDLKPDLIILEDYLMYGNGRGFISLIKKCAILNTIPIILCSTQSYCKALATSLNLDGYIDKPFDLAELEELIEVLLAKVNQTGMPRSENY